MKKIIALLLAMIMVLALAACAAKTEPAQAETTAETTAPAETTETTETAAPADGFKVAISLAEYNEWNKLYEAVIKEKCDEWGWTYEIFDSKQDASTQIDQVNSIIAQGFNAMTIQAVDNAALAPVVGQAADNGIIVVDHYGFADELGISDKIYKVLFGQKESGIMEAAEYVKIGGESGKVAIIAGLTGADNAQQRTAGFEEELAKYPDIEIVATQYCDWDTQKAQAAAEDIITANPDLKAFLVQDDGMSKGVWNAIEAAGKQDQIIIASQGFYEWSIPYLKEGKFAFTITYPAGFFARDAMNTIKAVERACELVELLGCGEVVDGVMDVIAKDNIACREKIVLHTSTAEGIIETAEDMKCDLIVMGSRGLTALKGLIMGSVTTGVLARTKCPVLLLRGKEAPLTDALRVGIAVDGSKYGMAAVNHVLKGIDFFGKGAQFYLINVVNDYAGAVMPDMAGMALPALSESEVLELQKKEFAETVDPLRPLFEKAGLKPTEVCLVGNPSDEIAAFAKKNKLDLIVMGSHGYTRFKSAVMGSTATHIAAEGNVPLLIIRAADDEAAPKA